MREMKLMGISFAASFLAGALITLISLFFHDLLTYFLFCFSPSWYFVMKHHNMEAKILIDILLCVVIFAFLLIIRMIKTKRSMEK